MNFLKYQKNPVSRVKMGDILESTWGYGQTNIDFFQVVDITPKRLALRKVGNKVVAGDGFTETVVPEPFQFWSAAVIRVNSTPDKYGYFHLGRTRVLRLWDGKPMKQTDSRAGN